MLSENKTKIISYPGPGDVVTGSGYPLPVILHKGYLLNGGVGENTAFLKYTYEQYSKLRELPPLDQLYKMIIDRDPITTLCDCGTRQDGVNSEKQLNEWIDKNRLKKKCKVIKKGH